MCEKGLRVCCIPLSVLLLPPSSRVGAAARWSGRTSLSLSAALWRWCCRLPCLRCLGFAMSFASFVSALPVVGAVSFAVAPVPAPSSLLASVPRARWSAPVSVVAVVRSGADSVSVSCSDGRLRVCRPSYASRALGRPVSVDAVFSRLSARVGSSVRFCAAFGYSPDSWFVGVEAV